MTRMHFEAIAGVIAQTFANATSKPGITEAELNALKATQAILVDNLALRLSYFNGNFKANKFAAACYQK